jgi:serine/threonine protein kinase/tetratricopeptide (TPR) repeat protein
MIGRTIGHYRVIEKLGEGGMGVVYRAEDTRLGRFVALKFLAAGAIHNESDRIRFQNEARSAAALRHPNICPIYSIDEAEGRTFISMAYLEGESLRDRVRRGPIAVEETRRIVAEIAEGLAEAHARGIVHRDIKSANVMLTRRGEAVILDFGLAKAAAQESVTLAGGFVGTLAYVSPEQARGQDVDHRADLWSLGVVWYEMLTGALPFRGESGAAIVYSILNAEPAPLRSLRPDAPAEVERMVARLLSRDPAARYPDAAALSADLGVSRSRTATSGSNRSQRADAPPSTSAPSIAVLPFTNLSADPEQDYFCAGIAEDILNDLTRIQGLNVAGRSTSFAHKDAREDLRQLGRTIGVDTILEGSVRKAGNRVRIAAQLIDVATGYHVWADRWDRELADIFAIQDEIAENIVKALKVSLTQRDRERLGKPLTNDLEAYDLYLRGRENLYLTARQVRAARTFFREAIQRDPSFARAYAGLAEASLLIYMYFEPVMPMLQEALQAAEKALALDADLAEAHTAKGFVLGVEKRFDEAVREFETAIRLNPNSYEAYYFYARTCFAQGKMDRAAELFEQAGAIDPNEYQSCALLVTLYKGSGASREQVLSAAERSAERVARRVAANPDDSRAYYLGSGALLELGRPAEAVEWIERAITIDPHDPGVHYNAACFFSMIGNAERAIDHLEKALDYGFGSREWIAHDPDLDFIRDSERFKALLSRLN